MQLEAVTFIKEVRRSFSQIGSVFPSSPLLGRAMAKPVKEATAPMRILEVGPGTGPITRQILKVMGPLDTLMVCEINRRFLDRLRQGLERNRNYRLHKDRVTFFHGPVQALRTEENFDSFDAIVSSLPFSNFTPGVVDDIFQTYRDLLAEGGCLSFCEYIGVRKIGALVAKPEDRRRVKAVDQVVKQWCIDAARAGAVKKEVTLLNVPPAFTVRFEL